MTKPDRIRRWTGTRATSTPLSIGSAALLIGLMAYNVAVPLLLVHSHFSSQATGVGLWPAVVLHTVFALWIAACIRPGAAPR